MNIIFDDIQAVRRARRTDPSTSKVAAQNSKRFSASHAGRIFEALKEGPRTAAGLSAMTGLSVEQVCRRLPELRTAHLAEPIYKNEEFELVVNGYRVWKLCKTVQV